LSEGNPLTQQNFKAKPREISHSIGAELESFGVEWGQRN
jgi:hypothetical protein